VNTLKTVFLAALLSAAAYGVYFAVNGPPRTRGGATDWEAGPPVVVSSDGAPEVSVGQSGAAGETVPGGTAGGDPPPFTSESTDEGTTAVSLPPVDGSQPSADEAGVASDQRYASNQRYPLDRAPPTQQDGQEGAAPDRYPSVDRYADRYPRSAGGEEAGGYPQTGSGGPDEAITPADAASTGDVAPVEDVHADFADTMRTAEEMLRAGRLDEAHLELSSLYGTPGLTLDEEGRLTELLDRLAGTVIYSRQHLLERAYEVQPGDTLERVADSYEVPWQLLANINGIREPGRLQPGSSLKVVRGPFEAYVDLSSFRLVLYVQGRYAGRFPIGIGKDRATPLGVFPVLAKVENPVYYGEQVVPAGDPNNPLGAYALNLGDGIFVHGTNDPRSIGRAESRGCIRLDNRDIKDLFEILTVKSDRSHGSNVTIIQSPADPPPAVPQNTVPRNTVPHNTVPQNTEPAAPGPILPPAETAGRPPAMSGPQRPSRL
jgi:lipoprotein-anchoring transpeptidase ErfK/SrfK